MTTQAETIQIIIREDGSREVSRKIGDIGKSAETSQSLLGGLKTALLGFAAFVGFRELISSTIEAEQHFAQLKAAVQSSGGVAGFTAEQLRSMSEVLQQTTTFSDDAVQGMQALLLSFKAIRGPEFVAAQQAIIDLSTRMGGDLQGAALQVGKALQNPTEGLTMLRRSGVTFTAAQVDVIKKLQQTGDIVGAQQKVLAGLTEKFGGAATAARNTFGGALSVVKNNLGDLLENEGGLPEATASLNELATVLKDPAVKESADQLFSILIRGAAGAASGIGKILAGINVMLTGGAAEVEKLNKQIETLESNRSTGMVTFGSNPFNDSTGVDFMGPKAIEKKIKELRAAQEALLGVGAGGIADKVNEFKITAQRIDQTTREIELTEEQINAIQSLGDALTKQSGEFAAAAKFGADNAAAMDLFHAKTELAKVGIMELTPELTKMLGELASNRAAAAQRQLSDSLKDQIKALEAQTAAGPMAAQALARFTAEQELAKQGAGKLTNSLDALFDKLERAQALNALGNIARDIADDTRLASLDAFNRGIEQQVISATKGLAVTQEEVAALREKFRALAELNEITQAQDSLLSASVEKRREFTTQLVAMQNLLANPGTGFSGGDAAGATTSILAGMGIDPSTTQVGLDAQLAQFQTFYEQLDQLRAAGFLSDQDYTNARVQLQIQENAMKTKVARDFFSTLSTLQSSSIKELAIIGKAAAITQAIINTYEGATKAYAQGGIYGVATAAAVVAAGLAQVAAIRAQPVGFATGGSFTVPGGGGVDSQMVAFRATPGERVNVATPTQVRKGDPTGGGDWKQPPPQLNARIVNVLDPALVGDFMTTPEGEQIVINTIRRNSDEFRSILGQT